MLTYLYRCYLSAWIKAELLGRFVWEAGGGFMRWLMIGKGED